MDCGRYFSLTSAYGNFDRNRVWPLNLLSLVETPIIIGEQYFRFDANCEEMFFFPERQKRLVAFGHDTSPKTTLELQKPISSFRKELM